jgi:hypothetical protein
MLPNVVQPINHAVMAASVQVLVSFATVASAGKPRPEKVHVSEKER